MSKPSLHNADTGDRLTRVLDVLALGAVLALAWRACHGQHRERRSKRSARAPAAVHTWEGEGGRPLPSEPATEAAAAP